MSGHHDDKYHGKERRADRKEAREQKKQDKKDGMTNKEAREDKHEMKKEDREKWKEEGHDLGGDCKEFASMTLDDVETITEVAVGTALL